MPKPKPISSLFVDFAENTTCHGCGSVARSRSWFFRLLWIVIILGAVFMLGRQIVQLWIRYRSNPISTSISVSTSALPFPSVTMCNQNSIRRSALDERGDESAEKLKELINEFAWDEGMKKRKKRSAMEKRVHQRKRQSGNMRKTVNRKRSVRKVEKQRVVRKKRNNGADAEGAAADFDAYDYSATDAPVDESYDYSATDPPDDYSENPPDYDATDAPDAYGDYGTEAPAEVSYDYSPTDASYVDENADYEATEDPDNYGWYDGTYDDYGEEEQPAEGMEYGSDGEELSEAELNEVMTAPDTSWQNEEYDPEFLARRKISNFISRLNPHEARAIGHQREDFIHKCSFMGRACDLEMLSHYSSTKYGNCYTFNSRDEQFNSIVVGRSGQSAALDIIFNLEHEEYLPMYTTGYGLIVVIHDFGTFPFPSEQGMNIAAGYHTSLALTMRNVTRLDKPYGDCVKGQWFEDIYDKAYTYEACAVTCLHAAILKACECYQQGAYQYYMFGENQNSTVPCDTRKEIECMRKVRKEKKRNLGCPCKQPCRETVFDTTLSFNQWPEKLYSAYLKKDACRANKTKACESFKDIDGRDLRSTLASISVYYSGLNYEEITQDPAYLLPNFLSDLGGTLGLWAGFSVLTCTEVILLVFHFFKQVTVNAVSRGGEGTENCAEKADDKKAEANGSKDTELA